MEKQRRKQRSIVAAARQNENAVAASNETMMITSTLETAGKDGRMKVTMITDEAARVRTTNKDNYDTRGGNNERDDCNEPRRWQGRRTR